MRILFLTDNFPPEVNAPANRTYEHCKEWVKAGVEVTVITCVPNFPKGQVYPGYKNKWKQEEMIDGIRVIRVWSYITANEGFIKRVLDYISYSITAFLAGLWIKTDVIVATSPQFFTALSGRWLGFFKRKPWIMEVRDIWPESIVAVGAMKKGAAIRFFEWLEKRMYKSATQIVVVTDAFKKNIVEKGIDP
ncbi:MAG TPA: glycosyltransferase family 4 protein, partial [Fluviicola sp.]|nr:glycosyltransferase family 4 protein [Fluviicola sp.]